MGCQQNGSSVATTAAAIVAAAIVTTVTTIIIALMTVIMLLPTKRGEDVWITRGFNEGGSIKVHKDNMWRITTTAKI